MFYKCKYFKIEELVDRETHRLYGEGAWMFFRPEALMALDDLREFFGVSVIVNNWPMGGNNQYRGFRHGGVTIGGRRSQHRLGNAFDCSVKGYTAEQARQKILENKDDPLLCRINCLEGVVNWLHFDCRNIPERIRVVMP